MAFADPLICAAMRRLGIGSASTWWKSRYKSLQSATSAESGEPLIRRNQRIFSGFALLGRVCLLARGLLWSVARTTMRTTIFASVLFVAGGTVPAVGVSIPEPVSLLVWGGALIALSVGLRSAFARDSRDLRQSGPEAFEAATVSSVAKVHKRALNLPLIGSASAR